MNEPIVSRERQELFVKNLRQQTAGSHSHLEENKYSKAILEPSVSLADYQVYIAKLYGVTKACENDVFPLIANVIPDVNERFKSEFIIDDLLKTGFTEDQTAKLPVYHFKADSISTALGIMYVLEGSTLGGKILYKHMNEYLGLDAETGASYFNGYGAQTGPFWKTFVSALTNFAVEENCEKEIISSAENTFSAIGNWLNEAEIEG